MQNWQSMKENKCMHDMFVCLSVCSFVCSFVRVFVCPYVRVFVLQFIHSFVRSFCRLVRFRWTVPAYGETKLKLLFRSDEGGQFDQTMNFELLGTRRRYQLFCRGLCTVPTICQEQRIVFPHRKKTMGKDEIVHKRFVLHADVNTYHFGPLHCGKDRDR